MCSSDLGGMRSRLLSEIVKGFWHDCLEMELSVSAVHLPWKANIVADWNLRFLRDSSDWRLDPHVFSRLCLKWGILFTNLFASRLKAQVLRFYSWRPDPEASQVDAFLQDWGDSLNYS